MGRVLNRFTYDMDVVDILLTQNMSILMIACSWYVAGVVVMVTILPWVGLAILPVTVLYWVLMLHYRKSGADLQRLDAVSRSPIQAMVTEGKPCMPCMPWFYVRGSIGF
jgi:ABC-type multidrug transport system fused ATPase/permease subunit